MRTIAQGDSSESLSCVLRPAPACRPCDFTGTSQPMLGVLFFPLSPQATKGPHTLNQGTTSSQLASQGRATTRHPSWVSQLPQDKSVKSKILQRNVTHPRRDPYSSSSILYIEFLSDFFPKFPFNLFFIN
jgi:hypothetical protein